MSADRSLRIVAAAVKVGDVVYEGKRHCEIIARIVQEGIAQRVTQEQQGFVASDGKFYSRFHSGAIAALAGQTPTWRKALLSEDLW
jgi:hypothetical protein